MAQRAESRIGETLDVLIEEEADDGAGPAGRYWAGPPTRPPRSTG